MNRSGQNALIAAPLSGSDTHLYFQLLLVLLSFLIGILAIYYLREFDVHDKEPFSIMAIVTFAGGALSIGISLALYRYLGSLGISDLRNAFGAIFVIGPVEEAAKLLALLLCYPIIQSHLDEPGDGLIYMACVALGFSLIENFIYVMNSQYPFYIMALRVSLATPMHISFSIFMGLAFYLLAEFKTGWPFMAIAFAYAALTHGLYDLVMFNQYIVLVLMLVIALAHYWTIKLLAYANATSPYRQSLREFIEAYDNPMVEEGMECLNCGNGAHKPTYRIGEIRIQKCEACERYITTLDSLVRMFRRFGSMFSGTSAYYIRGSDPERGYSTIYDGNVISDQKKIALFELDKLNSVLEHFTKQSKSGAIDIVHKFITKKRQEFFK